MKYPELFDFFERVECTSDGVSVYDFLGGAIDAAYKFSWERNVFPRGRKFRQGYPGLSEWTVDWVATLAAAKTAGDEFRVVELGAGYGQWMVTGILAYRALHSGDAYGVAIEADPTHYEWLLRHTERNLGNLSGVQTDLVHGAAGTDGTVEFPVIENPSQDYGASYARSKVYDDTVKVDCFSLTSVYQRFENSPVDLLHVDIQGAEVDLVKHPGFAETLAKTRMVLFGTHMSNEVHQEVRRCLESAGFAIQVDWPRNSTIDTVYGAIKTNDGALFGVLGSQVQKIDSIFDFSRLGEKNG